MAGVGFLDFALDENSQVATLDVAQTLESFAKAQMDSFLQENSELVNELALFQKLTALASEIKENTLFTSSMRSARLKEVWDLFLAENAPQKIHALRNEGERHNFKLIIERSIARPSVRFPAWLLYPLKNEVEVTIALLFFYLFIYLFFYSFSSSSSSSSFEGSFAQSSFFVFG